MYALKLRVYFTVCKFKSNDRRYLPPANIIVFIGIKWLETFPLNQEKAKDATLLTNILLEVLANAIRKRNNSFKEWKRSFYLQVMGLSTQNIQKNLQKNY